MHYKYVPSTRCTLILYKYLWFYCSRWDGCYHTTQPRNTHMYLYSYTCILLYRQHTNTYTQCIILHRRRELQAKFIGVHVEGHSKMNKLLAPANKTTVFRPCSRSMFIIWCCSTSSVHINIYYDSSRAPTGGSFTGYCPTLRFNNNSPLPPPIPGPGSASKVTHTHMHRVL